jgi:branched-chain amino acid transport system permease protein
MLQLLINIILSFSIYLLIGISFILVYYPTRIFHIAHAITLTSAAYFTFFFSKHLDIHLWLAVLLAIIISAILGMLCEIGIYKPLRKRKSSPMILLIASLGLYVVMQNVISLIWGDDTKSFRSGVIKVGHELYGAFITDSQIITILVCVALFIIYLLFMRYSLIGRKILAVSSNPEFSTIVGISSDKIILRAFAYGSVLAAVAGILIAFDTDMMPTMGFNWLLYGVVAMIIGGIGNNWGLLGGAFLLATAQHLSAYYIGSQWMDAIAYVILILFLIWKPLGFSGKQLKKVEI